jgi:hypothetical protein
MRPWKIWLSLLIALAGCSDQSSTLPQSVEPDADVRVDTRPANADAPMNAVEVSVGTGGASAVGGNVASGGAVGSGGVWGSGAASGSGGVAGTSGGLVTIDAATLVDSAGPAATGGQVGGAGAGGSVPTGGSTSWPAIDLGGTGGVVDSGGAGGVDLDGGVETDGGSTWILDLVPRSNSIPGWMVDPTNLRTSGQIAAVATTEMDAESLIDGAASDFFTGPAVPTTFVWQNYYDPSLPSAMGGPGGSTLSLYILKMPSAAQALTLYTSLRQSTLYAGNDWSDPTSPLVGARSRITDSGTDWWINFCKGSYYVEVRMTPSYGPPPDYAPSDAAQKKAAMDFASAIAARM